MLVNHAVMKQLDRTTSMLKVVNWTLGTPDWPQLTLEMVLFCVSVSSLQTSAVRFWRLATSFELAGNFSIQTMAFAW